MNFQFYVEKLQESEKYNELIKKNKKAFLCSCFFVIDKTGKESQQHFDFWDGEKIKSFQLEKGEIVDVANNGDWKPTEISLDLSFDFEDIEDLVFDRIEEEKIKTTVQKYLFSLQQKDGKNFLIGTVFISNLGMLRVNIDLDEMKIVSFEKKSFFDVLKVKGKNKD